MFAVLRRLFSRFKAKRKPVDRDLVGDAKTFSEAFNRQRIKHFTAKELQTLGASHYDQKSRGFGLNAAPPRSTWNNILRLAKVLDVIRDRAESPVRIHSCYRSRPYNMAIGGAMNSQHLHGKAADISAPKISTGNLWRIVIAIRDSGAFEGGIGFYQSSGFVHVDIRGSRADWRQA